MNDKLKAIAGHYGYDAQSRQDMEYKINRTLERIGGGEASGKG